MANVQKSKLLQKLGARLDKAVKAAASKEPIEANQPLPGGIENGEAELHTVEFGEVAAGKKNAGQMYCRLAATVISPETIIDPKTNKPIKVKGRQTSVLEMLCDTVNTNNERTTLEQHVESLENRFKLLGVPKEHFDGGGEALEEAAQMLTEAKPRFYFSTSLGKATPQYPTPKVFENWYGLVPEGQETPVDETSGMEDETGEGEEGEEEELTPDDMDPSNEEAEEGEEEEAEEGEGEDLEALAALADQKTPKGKKAPKEVGDAQDRLSELARELGLEEQAQAADNWAEVAELISQAQQEQEEEQEPEEEEEVEWSKGDTCEYSPPDPKNPKKSLKAVQCEVIGVNKPKRLADLKNLSGKQTWKGVSWDYLYPISE